MVTQQFACGGSMRPRKIASSLRLPQINTLQSDERTDGGATECLMEDRAETRSGLLALGSGVGGGHSAESPGHGAETQKRPWRMLQCN